MLDAIAEIQDFTNGLDLGGFTSDAKTLRAVEYNFVILGEAAGKVPDEIRARYSNASWLQIIGMRNIAVHQYRRIDPGVLWDTVQDNLPSLFHCSVRSWNVSPNTEWGF